MPIDAPQHISTHITANFHLGLSYNHDRVEEGRDFLSIASALTVRGEIQSVRRVTNCKIAVGFGQ